MPAYRSVGRFCSTVTKDITSLALLDANDLGFGAEAVMLSTGKRYRLGQPTFGTIYPVSVQASDAFGTWYQEDAVNDQTLFVNSVAGSIFTPVGPSGNTWISMPTGTGCYAAPVAKACWSLNTTTGVVTYTGPTASFVFKARFSMHVSYAGSGQYWEFDLTRNGAGIGSTVTLPTSVRAIDNPGGDLYAALVSPPLSVVSGDTLQYITRPIGFGSITTVLHYQACYQLLP